MRNWHFNHIDFSTYPAYGKGDLGVSRTPEKTLFRLWAPTARTVDLRLYTAGKGGKPLRIIAMERAEGGTWLHEEPADLQGLYYTFRVHDGEWLHEVPDPYARAVGVNGLRGMVIDLAATNPQGWEKDKGPRLKAFTDWIIYETHIRDFSISPCSGIHHKGKYLGFTEENTCNPTGEKTGLSYLKELGITHVHLLPVHDFQTVDEEYPGLKYNWGYDPQNFNAPEGSFATDPYDGSVRIREFKRLVKALHDHGIGVILDVVYNHTWLTKGSVFNQTVPGYFYRQNGDGSFANASGCGNEIASERSMVRKFIIDSLKYWIREYHIDGFRFDLMGIFDNETMRHIRYEIDKKDPGIFLYGEGWTGGPSPMPEYRRAVKKNITHLPGIAAFCDDMRDALKGNHGYKASQGFVSGLALREEAVKFGIVAATWHPQIVYSFVESSPEPWASEPAQCVNYVSCHDNYTLYDKLRMSRPEASGEELRRMVKLAGAILLTSQGVPFLHAGMEFCRSKEGHGNSYKSPDSVNQLDWCARHDYADVNDYYIRLIRLRKNHPLFRMTQAELIRKNLTFCIEYKVGVVTYCIKGKNTGDSWEQAIVIFNGNREEVTVEVPRQRYRVIAREETIDELSEEVSEGGNLRVPPVSMLLLAR
ncbi:MAG: type I pullulanase [Prolixibacteraceae bacterium]|jgi:pullulanase|nr:type I pullulanase [Prolixibacteraceae bacterium]HPJ78677.1 type I pullulanase [Prolixibacteraceae bacterium]HRV87818.1 type I pullulanase [Prolixibacteraceae bacterium]